jgi:elongation factor 1-alpha
VGLRLDVLHPRSGNSFAIEWSAEQPSAPSSQQEVDLSLVEAIQSALATESFSRSTSSSQQLTSLDRSFAAHSQRLVQMFESAAGDRDGGGLGREEKEEELSFPCLLLRANFDPFTIIKNSSLFTTTALYPSSSAAGEEEKSGFYDFSRCSAVYCMEDIWDLLCFSSNQYLPGQDFPITPRHSTASSSSSSRPNMAIALGHTPFLFSLYLERSCLYQSCLNVTGDLMAYASTTFQWAKLFYDCFYFLHRSHRMEMGSSEAKGEDSTASMIRSSRRTHVEVGLMALVSYSYACESRQTSPSKSTVLEMFGQQTKATQSSAGAGAAVATAPESPYKIFSRESLPGLTCPLAFSTLLATSSLYSFPQDPPAAAAVWNSLLFTLFSRFCESISGVKVIRNNNSSLAPPLAPPDLRELEESYRLCVGQIQVTLQRRLYVEWPKLDHTEKLHIVSQCATDLSRILKTIVTSFLSGFDRYGLPLWSELVSLMETCLSLQHRGAGVGEGGGIACLREMYSRCDVNLNSVIEDLVSQASRHEEAQAVMATLSLPVVKQQQPGGCCLCLQEMDPVSDIEELLAYVEAILATKVSPKIEYKPITRPQHPSLPASVNQALRVTSHLSSWNTANPVVNIGLIGNVNSGKSTLSGRILYDLGLVDKDLVDSRLSEEVKRLGYTSDLRHAWVLDKLQAERSQNVTIVPKFKGFETSLRRYTLIDNPGHKDYLSNVTEGIFQTDIALLLVSGVESERQISGLVNNFLEEFLINAFCYSIKHLVVIINKMDAARYAEEEYLTACESVKKHLKKAGYKINANTVQFIPVSALAGEGIVSTSTQMPWYTGPCLLQLLDEVVIPKRHSEKPLRMVVSEIHKVPGIGVVLCGKVECGSVSVGDMLSCYPDTDTSLPLQSQKGKGKSAAAAARKSSSSSAPLRVTSIECHHISLPSASPGDNIGIAVSSTGNISTKSFSKGMILTLSSLPPVPVFVHFEAQLILLKKITIRSGYRPTLLINGNHVPVKITRLLSLIDKNNTVLETSPTSVTQSQICICEMVAQKPFAAETIHDLPKLSKFLIRQNRLTVAIGFIRAPLA